MMRYIFVDEISRDEIETVINTYAKKHWKVISFLNLQNYGDKKIGILFGISSLNESENLDRVKESLKKYWENV